MCAGPGEGNGFGYHLLSEVYEPETVQRILRDGTIDEEPIALEDLLVMDPTETITLATGPETSETPLYKDLADLTFGYYIADCNVCQKGDRVADIEGSEALELRQHLIEAFGGDALHTYVMKSTVTEFADRRVNADQRGEYILYYFIEGDAGCQLELPAAYSSYATRMGDTGHYPHHADWGISETISCDPPSYICYACPDQPSLDDKYFIVIIDELTPEAAVDPGKYIPEDDEGIRTRRIIESNRAGFMIGDRTWRFENGESELVEVLGTTETRKYDEKGRLTELRSRGWNSPANQIKGGDPEENGLITVFEYEDSEPNEEGELKAVGVKKGTEGDVLYQSLIERGIEGRPELITKQVVFPEPVLEEDLETAEGDEILYEYIFDETKADPREWPMLRKTTIYPAAPVAHYGGDDYFAIEVSQFNERGNLDASGVGLAKAYPPSSGDVLRFFINTHTFDDLGRVLSKKQDDELGEIGDSEWVRVSTLNPLNYLTEYAYDTESRLILTTFPDETEQHVFYRLEDHIFERWVYSDVYWNVGRTQFFTQSPIEKTISDEAGRVLEIKKFELPDGEGDDAPDGDEAGLEEVASLTPEYDAHGNIAGIGVGGDGGGVEGKISYDFSGEIARQQDPSGLITRYEYDWYGRLRRTLRGSLDEHEYWGYPPPTDNDDLMVVEKRYYGDGRLTGGTPEAPDPDYVGEGIHDAGRLLAVRDYRNAVEDRYYEIEPGQPGDNDEDEIGLLTLHRYDWRMRPVWIERRDESGDPLSYSITWLDHQDRVRFRAEYGPVADFNLGAEDPRALYYDSEAEFPTAGEILTAETGLISLTETLYDARGNVREERMYDVSETSGDDYLASFHYYDHGGRQLEIVQPSSPIRRHEYDALGRMVASTSCVVEEAGQSTEYHELERSENEYDTRNRIIATRQFTRLHNDTSSTQLDESNSIASYRQNWYDKSGRIILTADFGTNSDNDEYATDSAPAAHTPDEDLRVFNQQSERLDACIDEKNIPDPAPRYICHEYDESGREIGMIGPDGAKTEYQYDALGRMRLMIDDALASSRFDRQITAHRYADGTGLLTRIAAVLPDHFANDDIPDWDADIDWEADDGSIQVTEMEYGADVLEQDFDDLTLHPGLVSEVRYPDGNTGRPSTLDVLSLRYNATDAVAERIDGRGVVIQYEYDEYDRLDGITFDDSAWFEYEGLGESPWAPPIRVASAVFNYDAFGRLLGITTKDGSTDIISDVAFDYDPQGNLTKDQIALWEAVSGSTPAVEYLWSFSPADTFNHNRLIGIDYPERPDDSERRSLSVSYGNDGDDIDSQVGRITGISDGDLGALADYGYSGVGRTVTTELGNGLELDTGAVALGYGVFNRFGERTDLHYLDSVPSTALRYQYGRDEAGRILWSKVKQRDVGSDTRDNVRSWLYDYDDLGRLINAHMGKLNTGKSAIEADPDVPLARKLSWELDSLGHWAGGSAAAGSHILQDDLDGDGNYGESGEADAFFHDTADASNRLDQRDHENGAAVDVLIHDLGGDLVFDGTYFYQYDSLHRLIEVRQAGEFDAEDFDAETGRVVPDTKGQGGWEDYPEPGDVILRYFYDGLGRLVERRCPESGSTSDEHIERYTYDGVRRVQELVCTAGCASGPTFTTLREYVHGPEYVDQFLLQINQPGATTPVVSYVLQDDNYNVVALANTSGQVIRQHALDPYGNLIARDDFPAFGQTSAPKTRLGHQGLTVDRLDAPWDVDLVVAGASTGHPAGSTASPDATPRLITLNRNRTYDPLFARFNQRDPNETGLPLVAAAAMKGQGFSSPMQGVELRSAYADGLNLFAYIASNPVNRTDPTGLFFYGDVGMANTIRSDLMSLDMDTSASFMDAIRGIAGFMSYRSQMLDDAAAAAAIEESGRLAEGAMAIYAAYQMAQLAHLGTGLFKTGFKLAAAGYARLMGKTAKNAGLVFKAFTARNFRDNLKVLTDFDATTALHAHHIFPQKFRDNFDSAGINIDDPKFGAWWEARAHNRASYEYNQRWDEFFRESPSPRTAAEMKSFARDLAALYGLTIHF